MGIQEVQYDTPLVLEVCGQKFELGYLRYEHDRQQESP
jgi:hypothetical protein